MHFFVWLRVVNTRRTLGNDVVKDMGPGMVLWELPVFRVLFPVLRLLDIIL